MAQKDWRKEKFKVPGVPGVYYRKHPTRKHGVKFDQYFFVRYKWDRRGIVAGQNWQPSEIEEGIGWATDGHTAVEAGGELEALKANQDAYKKDGKKVNPDGTERYFTLREKRLIEEKKETHAREKEEADRRAKIAATKTLQEYWDETYFPAAKRSKKASSWSKEESHFRLWIAPLMGDMPLKNIDLSQWDELVKILSKNGKSQRMQLYVTGTLRRILKHAFERRLVSETPPSGKRIGVSSPGNNRRLRVISHEEEASIMGELELRDLHAWRITRFAFLTGCRVSEAFNLVWANVDCSRNCIIFPETKNHDSRVIPLTPPLQELFASMEPGALDQRVFVKSDGTPYTQAPYAFNTSVDKLELNAGRTERDRIVFHSIRHSVATRLASRLGPRDLMDVMGWRTVQMAMRYVHSNEDLKAKALSALGITPQAGKVLPFQTKGTA